MTLCDMTSVCGYGPAPARPLTVGLAVGDQIWLDRPDDVVRVRAVDLRDAARQTAAARQEWSDATVLVDIDVMIAHQARTALAAARAQMHTSTLCYVGTPTGLAGLISDIHRLGIADGAVLIPLDSASPGVADLIRDEVFPALRTMGRWSPSSWTRAAS